MVSEIIRYLLNNVPLGIALLILALLVIIVLSVVLFHKRLGIEKFWFITFSTKLAGLEQELTRLRKAEEEKPIEPPRRVEPPELPGRYFLGIDIGRYKIDYCLIDYDRFKENPDSPVKIIESEEDTPVPDRFKEDIYPVLGNIIAYLSTEAKNKGIPEIHGIGLGLPGQVEPRKGILIKSPGFYDVNMEIFIPNLSRYVKRYLQSSLQHPEILKEDFRIEIDNDVRCATRYLWKRMGFDDVICIFVGNGLGSGIVLGGKMLYGHNFTAGEIGHITISSERSDLLRGQRCKCGKEGYHWEMYASSYGMINIAKYLNPEEYERLKKEYNTIIQQEKYQTLLQDKRFKEYSKEHFDEKGELTSYFFSLAFHAGEKYARKVVEEFIKYLAVGIANYINVINPQIVYLGGGMIEGFYTSGGPVNVITSLYQEVNKYVLPSAMGVTIERLGYEERKIADIGAAFIFKDQSYFDYKNR